MIGRDCVLGVSGCVGFGFATQHSGRPVTAGLAAVCVGCVGFYARARMRASRSGLVGGNSDGWFFFYARTEKPNKPNTPNTDTLKVLICKGFKCVGFVLGSVFLCRVGGGA